jgi:seryl-tRNA(Sec) selenium transferase
MMVNLENYIENQKRKQEKKMKRALASYEESLKREQDALTASPEPASPLPGKKQPEDKPKNAVMTDKELSARILQLQAIAVEKRTLAEENELNDLASNAQGESQEEVGL